MRNTKQIEMAETAPGSNHFVADFTRQRAQWSAVFDEADVREDAAQTQAQINIFLVYGNR